MRIKVGYFDADLWKIQWQWCLVVNLRCYETSVREKTFSPKAVKISQNRIKVHQIPSTSIIGLGKLLVLIVLYLHKFVNFNDVILSVKNSFCICISVVVWGELNIPNFWQPCSDWVNWQGCQHCVFCKNPKQQPLCGSSEMESALKCSIHSKILDFASSFIISHGDSDGRAG